MSLSNAEIVDQIAEQIENVFIDHLPDFSKANEDAKANSEQGEQVEDSPVELANKVKLMIVMQYINDQLLPLDKLVSQESAGDLYQQFGVVCSRSFLNSVFKALKLALEYDEQMTSRDRLVNFAKHMSNVQFAEKGILDSMGGRIELVDKINNLLRGVSKFALNELPETLTNPA